MSELKPCPFCSAALYIESGYHTRAWHPITTECWVSGSSWRVTEEWVRGWNTRPIEDELRAKVKELEETMPDPWELTLIAMSQRVAGREDLYKKLEEMIRKIEKVSKSK